ncbi:winged helix DNA-binding domain-containing protein [Streptomyces sp. SID13031]|uniref:winged helix DNA-binding domain-containing protein n=1 Tax=Streptomyces sp. SID13031 TaxID=2706046 RepID=UPI0013C63C8E|nr:winged helix DNA-binding domain-containing protein [Streptomyces sp. SID13031]NEA33406.1 winged helix DNA-binding domain-containing protein [Streptomyces sp. SID13031]
MRITAQELNRATLARQLLLEREAVGAVEGTRRIVAIQAQHPASPYIALWNRLIDFDPVELDTAFAEGQLVKATLMRFTLHTVHLDDHLPMHVAMQPTLRTRLPKERAGGLTLEQAHELVPGLLEFLAEPRSNAQIEGWIGEHSEIPGKDAWWGIRSFAPMFHAPTGGPWSFGQRPAYVAAARLPGLYSAEHAATALESLVWRYLEGFGPASIPDIAQFASVQRARARDAVESLRDRLTVLQGPDGKDLYDVPDAPRPPANTPAPPRLMAMWDSTLLAYDDRSRIVPAEYKSVVTRTNGDVLPTLLVDGHVAGLWRPTPDGIEATAFRPLPAKVWKALAAEAEALVTFLADREPGVYTRYNRWWSSLPAGDTRLLAG